MNSSVSGLCCISLTRLSSGVLQDQCVYFRSGILHHFMAPSTGYQLCEPPTEPQLATEGKGRKGQCKGEFDFIFLAFAKL